MPRLALVMIARNAADSIARCLESVKPHVDEMIVLDTGSTDATASIASTMGARVYHFEWVDDFSAARNEALAHSSADWNLILDADEWIEGNPEQLSPAVLGKGPFIGVIPVSSRFDIGGREECSISWISRILPKGVRYRGRIHEQPVSDLVRIRLPIEIGHDGYKHDKLSAKKDRNEALLLQALEEDPSNAYYMYQLGKMYEICEEYTTAVKYFGEALQRANSGDSFRHDLTVRTIFSLKKAREYELAVDLAGKELPFWGHSPDFFFALGDLLLDLATLNPATAHPNLLPMIEASWLKCLEIGDQPGLDGSVKGRGSHLAAYNLSVLYDGVGNKDKAAFYRDMSARMRETST